MNSTCKRLIEIVNNAQYKINFLKDIYKA